MSKKPKDTAAPDESPRDEEVTAPSRVRDAAIERALAHYLSRKGWKSSKLAEESGVSVGVVHQALLGYAPSVATLRRLCASLGVDLWVFLLLGEMLSGDWAEVGSST